MYKIYTTKFYVDGGTDWITFAVEKQSVGDAAEFIHRACKTIAAAPLDAVLATVALSSQVAKAPRVNK